MAAHPGDVVGHQRPRRDGRDVDRAYVGDRGVREDVLPVAGAIW